MYKEEQMLYFSLTIMGNVILVHLHLVFVFFRTKETRNKSKQLANETAVSDAIPI